MACGFFARYAGRSIVDNTLIYTCRNHESLLVKYGDEFRDLPAPGLDWA